MANELRRCVCLVHGNIEHSKELRVDICTECYGMYDEKFRIEFFKPRCMFVRPMPKIGRNEKCKCGSDKKFKKCCGGTGDENVRIRTTTP